MYTKNVTLVFEPTFFWSNYLTGNHNRTNVFWVLELPLIWIKFPNLYISNLKFKLKIYTN